MATHREDQIIILDTNVISEMMKQQPDPIVGAWYLQQNSALLCTTAITLAEVLFGLSIMSSGRRRNTLAELFHVVFEEGLRGRVLPFDEHAARHYARIRSENQRRGLAMEAFDEQIAAIAVATDASVATRNTAHFDHCGVALLNPWLS